DKKAVEYLDFALAPDLYTVTNELEKVKLYVGDADKVSLDELKEIVAVSRSEDIFEVVRFVGEGRGQRAVEAVHRLLAAGESELGIMALLSRQVKLFWQAKVLAGANLGKKDIAKRLKVPRSFVDEYIEGGGKLKEPRLAKLHGSLYDLDRRIKTGRITPRIALESFIAESAKR
ncbi:MAG: DNA polymerase III subunit delta, partial [bacterium]|nr:DNA polymerase III subunit delta [bacterium]